MKKVKIIAGITWALISLIVILVLFPGLNGFSESASKLPFMKINPNYTGGEVARQMTSEGCTLDIRKPVFDGLTGERRNGFVQLDWRGNVPAIINDTIDFNLDGVSDFAVLINRNEAKTELVSLSPVVKNLGVSTQTSYGWSIRVELEKEKLKMNDKK